MNRMIMPNYKMLSVVALLSVVASGNVFAKEQLLTAEILNTTPNQIQKVPLNLGLLAAVSLHQQQVDVRDANNQAMPYRLETVKQVTKQTDTALQVYQWPTRQNDENWQQLEQLKLQLKQGESETTLTWPSQLSTQKTAKQQAQTWLLVSPDSEHNVTARQLLLNWTSQPLSSRVQVEGSNDLSNWEFAGTGSILETRNATRQVVKQQQIDVQNAYRFWRVQFDQPLLLQGASLRSQYDEAGVWQLETFKLSPSSQAGQWLLKTDYPLEVQRFQFDIPKNQLWSVSIDSLQNQQGRDLWQPAIKTELFDLDDAAALGRKDQVALDAPLQSAQWRVNIQGTNPQQPLQVKLSSPQRYVLFLAQGKAPYQLVIGGDKSSAAQLPSQLQASHQAMIGQVELKAAPTSYQRYALWAGLIFLVLLLAFAAWRLLRASQNNVG